MQVQRVRRHPSVLIRIVSVLALTGLVAATAPAVYAADSWLGTRHCNQFESCRVQSYATGNVQHWRYNVGGGGGVLKASWSNGGSYIWRTSWHGSGSQDAFIYTSGILSSQYAQCVCVVQHCPE